MAKNANEKAIKSRQTKLGKKTAEELIDIILRKDKTERNLNSQIANLKAEVNSLTSRVNSFDKDQEGNVKAISTLREEVSYWHKKYDNFKAYAYEEEDKLKKEYKDTVERLTKDKSIWQVIAIAAGVVAIGAIVLCIL